MEMTGSPFKHSSIAVFHARLISQDRRRFIRSLLEPYPARRLIFSNRGCIPLFTLHGLALGIPDCFSGDERPYSPPIHPTMISCYRCILGLNGLMIQIRTLIGTQHTCLPLCLTAQRSTAGWAARSSISSQPSIPSVRQGSDAAACSAIRQAERHMTFAIRGGFYVCGIISSCAAVAVLFPQGRRVVARCREHLL